MPTSRRCARAYAFTDLQSFLDIYYAGASVLLKEEDFFDMALAYLRTAAADNVVHAEIFFDPQTHTERGVPIETVIVGLSHALRRAHAELGHQRLADPVLPAPPERRGGVRDAWSRRCPIASTSSASGSTAASAAIRRRSSRASSRAAAQLGLHVVAHAGEEGPPAYIESALDVLKVERIDHGVRCVESPPLVQRLARERMPLTVCPLSNVKLCVFKTMADHNLPALLDAGLVATVNSDDPAYFGGYVNDNFRADLRGAARSSAHATPGNWRATASTPASPTKPTRRAGAPRWMRLFPTWRAVRRNERLPGEAPEGHNDVTSFRRDRWTLHGAITFARPRRCSVSSAHCWSQACWSAG